MGTDATDAWYEVDVEDEQILEHARDFVRRYMRSHGDVKKANEAALDHLVRLFPRENRHTLTRALEQVSGQRLAVGWVPDDPHGLLDGPMEEAPETKSYGPGGIEAELRQWPTTPDSLMKYAELVPIEVIDPAREFDRAPGQADFEGDPQRWAALKEHIQHYGMMSPVVLEYNPDTGEAYVGEGNHRIQLASRLGFTHVPVVVYRARKGVGHGGRGIVLEAPWKDEPYVPQYIKPSQVGLPTKTARRTVSVTPSLAIYVTDDTTHDEDDDPNERTMTYHAVVGDAQAGHLQLVEEAPGQWLVYDVKVDERFRRKGIATQLLNEARSQLGNVRHADEESRTPDGSGWAAMAMALNPADFAKYPKALRAEELPTVIPGFEFYPSRTLPEGSVLSLQTIPLELMGTGTQPKLETYSQNGEWWDQWGQRPEGYHQQLQQSIDEKKDIPPMVLVESQYEPGRYDIADGWHRGSLARNLGMTEFPAYVYAPQHTSKVAAANQWVYVHGVVKFGDSLHELAKQAAMEAKLSDTEVARISNLIARGQIPSPAQVAAGTMAGGRPNIWMSTCDRNAIISAVLEAASARPAL